MKLYRSLVTSDTKALVAIKIAPMTIGFLEINRGFRELRSIVMFKCRTEVINESRFDI